MSLQSLAARHYVAIAELLAATAQHMDTHTFAEVVTTVTGKLWNANPKFDPKRFMVEVRKRLPSE
jgi:hypothetical protein